MERHRRRSSGAWRISRFDDRHLGFRPMAAVGLTCGNIARPSRKSAWTFILYNNLSLPWSETNIGAGARQIHKHAVRTNYFGALRIPFRPQLRPRAVRTEDPCLAPIAETNIEAFPKPLPCAPGGHGRHHLDAFR